MGFQWDAHTAREWLLRELDAAVERVGPAGDEPAGNIARGEVHALHRVLHHIFDDIDVDVLDAYLQQIDQDG